MTAEGWAYVAGFFDGEGCIHIAARRRRGILQYELIFTVCNTNLEALQKIHRDLGMGNFSIRHYDNGKWKSVGLLRITNANQQSAFLDGISPYAVIKKPQIDVARDFLATRVATVGQSLPELESLVRKECHSLIKELNRRGPGLAA